MTYRMESQGPGSQRWKPEKGDAIYSHPKGGRTDPLDSWERPPISVPATTSNTCFDTNGKPHGCSGADLPASPPGHWPWTKRGSRPVWKLPGSEPWPECCPQYHGVLLNTLPAHTEEKTRHWVGGRRVGVQIGGNAPPSRGCARDGGLCCCSGLRGQSLGNGACSVRWLEGQWPSWWP